MIPTIIIPDVQQERQRTVDRAEWLRQWEEDYAEGREVICPPRNIRFAHNPAWRDNWLSIQSAHDKRHWIWWMAWGLMGLAAYGYEALTLGYWWRGR